VQVPMTETALSYQAGVSIMVVYLINFLKKTKLCPFLTQQTAVLNRLVSAVLAFLATAGITTAVHGTFSNGLQVVLVIPPASTLLDFVIHYFAQFGFQEAFYTQVAKNGKNTGV